MPATQPSQLDDLSIPEPCPMAAELARGGKPDRRYCQQCKHDVVNFGALDRAAAEAEVRAAQESGERMCVRMIRDPENGQVLTREDLQRLTARFAQKLPQQLAAALALSILHWSCAEPKLQPAESLDPSLLQMTQPRHELLDGFDPRLGKMMAIPLDAQAAAPPQEDQSIEPPRQLDASKECSVQSAQRPGSSQ